MNPNHTTPTQIALAPGTLSTGVCAETGEAPDTTVLLRFKHSLTAEQINERAAGLTRGDLTYPQLAGISLLAKHVVEPSGAWRVSLSLSSYHYVRHPDDTVSRFWRVGSVLVLKPSASGALLLTRRSHSEFTNALFDPQDIESIITITIHQMVKSAISQARVLNAPRDRVELGGTLGDLLSEVKYADDQSVWHRLTMTCTETTAAVTGVITQITSRCPQLVDLMPPELAGKNPPPQGWGSARVSPIKVMPYLLGASDMREVTERMFGKTRVNKPLIRACTRLLVERPWYDSTLIWARLFRGLVPTEDITAWVEKSMESKNQNLPIPPKKQQDRVRAVLRNLPQPVIRRLLARPILETVMGLADLVYVHHPLDPVLLGEVVRLRGHRHIRNVNDLEQLAETLPKKESIDTMRSRIAAERRQSVKNWIRVCDLLQTEGGHTAPTWEQWQDPDTQGQLMEYLERAQQAQREEQARIRAEQAELRRQEQMAREAEKVARTAQLRGPLDKIRIGQGKDQLKVVVAKDAETLSRWGSQMGHCIASYSGRIELETMFAVVDAQGTVLVNGHIDDDHLTQLYAKRNNRAQKALSQEHLDQLLDAIEELGVNTTGAAGLQ